MDGMGYDDFTLCVPKGSVDVYKNSDFGKMFREVVEESQSGIDEVADSESVDGSLPVEVYSTGGVLIYNRGVMADSLIPAGIYHKTRLKGCQIHSEVRILLSPPH